MRYSVVRATPTNTGPGEVCEACAREVRVCLPRADCEWLNPGCGSRPLPAAGCEAPCIDDCPVDEECIEVSVNRCEAVTCPACDARKKVCLPRLSPRSHRSTRTLLDDGTVLVAVGEAASCVLVDAIFFTPSLP